LGQSCHFMHWCCEHTTHSFHNENQAICICTGQALYHMLRSIRKETSLDYAPSFTCTPTSTSSKLLEIELMEFYTGLLALSICRADCGYSQDRSTGSQGHV